MAPLEDYLKKILVRDQLIYLKDLQRILDEQKKTGQALSAILVRLNLMDEDTLTHVLSRDTGYPPIRLVRLKIDPEIIKIIPRDIAVKYQVIPVSSIGNQLTLAVADPLDIVVFDNIKVLTGYTIIPVISNVRDIVKKIEQCYDYKEPDDTSTETFDEIIKDIKDTEELELITDAQAESTSVEELKEEAPIIKLTNTIIQHAVLSKASDVFIEPLEKALRVRYRIDGIIRETDRMEKALLAPIVSRIKVIANMDISEHRLPQDGRFKTVVGGRQEVNFRVNVLPSVLGERIVLRVLDQNASVADIEKLGFEARSLKRLCECVVKPHGLVLACGPTGSGKTTTLYSILKYVDSPKKNIVTVEDPVECQIKGLNQVNINPAFGLTFPVVLRSILRQDPNIIMIGEIRDAETLDIAVKAALTGHLVLSSLHTTTAAGSIVRMENMGIEPFLISSAVLAIVAQRLLRKICPDCRESLMISKVVADRVGLSKMMAASQNPVGSEIRLFYGKGCKSCFNTGYKGRIGITEILIFSARIKELVLGQAGEANIKEAARAQGMMTMREDGLLKAINGLTSLEEVLRVTAGDQE